MNITEFVEKFGRTLFEAPLAPSSRADEPAELGEIRLAILDEVRRKSYRAGGRKVFPFDLVRVELRGVDRQQHGVFTGAFFRKYLEQEIRSGLRGDGCMYPESLRIEVQAEIGLPKPGVPWLTVSAGSQQPGGSGSGAARLLVVEGMANCPEIRLDRERTNIGRVVDVYRSEGLFRRNDLAFAEDTEINRSVSREHAHVVYDRAAGEYRLFNDRWYPRGEAAECGVWIIRNGMSHEVHRDPRGTKLEPGDEIRLGRAALRFEF